MLIKWLDLDKKYETIGFATTLLIELYSVDECNAGEDCYNVNILLNME
jgi:hypothetical protein